MGIYYNATTIIGYRISTKNCYDTETIEPSCEHTPPPNVQFCPTCGRKVQSFTRRHAKELYRDNFIDEFANNLVGDYVYEEMYDGYGDQFWFGYGSQAYDDDVARREPKPYDEIKTDIAALLKPFIDAGLFVLDERDFGVWTIHAAH
jgi:hypothetical protein